MQLDSFDTKCDACGNVHGDGRLHVLKFHAMTIHIGNTCVNALLETLIGQFGIPSKFNDD